MLKGRQAEESTKTFGRKEIALKFLTGYNQITNKLLETVSNQIKIKLLLYLLKNPNLNIVNIKIFAFNVPYVKHNDIIN